MKAIYSPGNHVCKRDRLRKAREHQTWGEDSKHNLTEMINFDEKKPLPYLAKCEINVLWKSGLTLFISLRALVVRTLL
jgi:hypothetical protein